MDCQLFERQMQRYIDGRLAMHEQEDVLRHAAACPACAALLQDMTALDGLLGVQLSGVDPPEGFAGSVMSALPAPYRKPALRVLFPRKQWQRWGSAAAAAVLLIAAGVYGLLPSTPEQVVAPEPLYPGIVDILEAERDNTPKLPQQPQQGVQVAESGGEDNTITMPENPLELPTENVVEPIQPIDTPAITDNPVNSQENGPEEIPADTPPDEEPPARPQVTSVDLPKPAAYNPQPEGVLSRILLAAYEDCDAILPSLNDEGLVEFYVKYKGINHLWTQTLSAEEAPVYVGQVKALPSLSEITVSTDASATTEYACVTAVAPDGRVLAVNRGGEQPGVWLFENAESIDVAALDYEQEQPIPGGLGGGKILSWSPDGNKLLYSTADNKLFVYYLAEQLPLELYGGSVSCASWAEDSKTVVFAAKESKEQRSAIYSIIVP